MASIANDTVDEGGFGPLVESLLVPVRVKPLIGTTVRVPARVIVAIVIVWVPSLIIARASARCDARRGVGSL